MDTDVANGQTEGKKMELNGNGNFNSNNSNCSVNGCSHTDQPMENVN
ncbi:unnamed protein product, partial [Allacma fusca]